MFCKEAFIQKWGNVNYTESDGKPTMQFVAFISNANIGVLQVYLKMKSFTHPHVILLRKKKDILNVSGCSVQSDNFDSEDLEYASQVIWINYTQLFFGSH